MIESSTGTLNTASAAYAIPLITILIIENSFCRARKELSSIYFIINGPFLFISIHIHIQPWADECLLTVEATISSKLIA
jgi:hypothetical protein